MTKSVTSATSEEKVTKPKKAKAKAKQEPTPELSARSALANFASKVAFTTNGRSTSLFAVKGKKKTVIDYSKQKHLVSPELLQQIKDEADPTQNKSYVSWIRQLVTKKDVNKRLLIEDFYKVYSDLQVYDAAKRKNMLQGEFRDIMKFKSHMELYSFLEQNKLLNNKEILSDNELAEFALVAETERMKIYIPKTFKEAQALNGQSRWCTSANESHFKNYSGRGNLIIFSTKESFAPNDYQTRRWQLHIQDSMFADIRDYTSTSIISFIKGEGECSKYPEREDVAQFLGSYVHQMISAWEESDEVGVTNLSILSSVLMNNNSRGGRQYTRDLITHFLSGDYKPEKELFSKAKIVSGDLVYDLSLVDTIRFPLLEKVEGNITFTGSLPNKFDPKKVKVLPNLKHVGGSLDVDSSAAKQLGIALENLEYIGDLTLNESVKSNLKNLTSINNLEIKDYKYVMESLENITGNLTISSPLTHNPIPKIVHIGGAVNGIIHADKLKESFLGDVKSIGGDIQKFDELSNPAIIANNVEFIGGNIRVGRAGINMPNLKQVGGTFQVIAILAKTDKTVDAFNVTSLEKVGGGCHLHKCALDSLFPNLKSVGDNLTLNFSTGSLPSLKEVGNSLFLTMTYGVGFPELVSVKSGVVCALRENVESQAELPKLSSSTWKENFTPESQKVVFGIVPEKSIEK